MERTNGDVLAQLEAHDLPLEACKVALQRFDTAEAALDFFFVDTEEGRQLCAKTLEAALHQAVSNLDGGPEHQRQEVRRLLEQRAQVNLPSTHGDTPLMLAVRAAGSLGTSELPNRLAVVRELLVMRAQPDTADSEGETALMEAVCMGDLSLCGLLLEARADPERQSSAGAKAQDFCSNEELSRLLLSWSSRVTNIQGLPWERHPSAPEVFAMDADDSPRSGSFKEDDDIPTASASEAPQEMPGSSEEKLLSIAQDVGGGKTLRELLEGRADPNCRNFMQEAVLLLAVRASSQRRGQQSDAERLESVRILLHCRADPDVNDDQGETPLMEAACLGDLPICRLLLEKRASLTHASATGATALQFAQEHDDVLRCFQAMHSGFSEEEVEREQGQQEITENLKPEAFFPEWLRGADADYADPTATAATDATAKAVRPPAVRTLWELAALQDAQAIRELSFSESININQVDADGYTALHVSLFSPCLDGGKAQIDTVRCLLLVRADPNFRGGKELPLKVAAESVLPPTRLEVMRLLLEARAQAATSDEEPKPKPPKQRSSEANAEVSADLLFEAAESHAAKRLSLLTDPTLANCCDADGHSLLHRCLMAPPFDMNGQEQLVETVKALLTSRATPNKQNARGESPLLLTVRGSSSGRLKVLRQLMKANADSNLGDAQDTTPLIEAVRFGDLEVCRLLLDRGADAQLRGAHGLSAVDLAWRSSSKMREVFESQGLSPQDCTAQPEGGSVELSLRHASTQLERVISVPADASIRDVKKMFVRLTQRGSWRRLALLCDDTGRLLRDGDPLGVRRRLLVADAKAIPTEEELPEEEQWLRWTLEELQQEAQQRGLRLVHATRETLLTCLHQARSWEALSSGDLRQESMRRGLPESCDRKEVLHMLKQDLSWEHMEEVELKEDCLLQRVALPEAQETLLFVRAMRSRLRQALRWQHLDTEQLRKACELRHFNTAGKDRGQLLELLNSFKVMPQPKASPKVEPRKAPKASAKSSATRQAPRNVREVETEDFGEGYPPWMSERVRKACSKYPNFSGKFIQEMEDWSLQDVEMYLYSNGFLKPKKQAQAKPKPSRSHYQLLGVEEGANASEIRKAYRRLALIYHPDKNPEDPEAAAETFRRLADAYEALMAAADVEDVAG